MPFSLRFYAVLLVHPFKQGQKCCLCARKNRTKSLLFGNMRFRTVNTFIQHFPSFIVKASRFLAFNVPSFIALISLGTYQLTQILKSELTLLHNLYCREARIHEETTRSRNFRRRGGRVYSESRWPTQAECKMVSLSLESLLR